MGRGGRAACISSGRDWRRRGRSCGGLRRGKGGDGLCPSMCGAAAPRRAGQRRPWPQGLNRAREMGDEACETLRTSGRPLSSSAGGLSRSWRCPRWASAVLPQTADDGAAARGTSTAERTYHRRYCQVVKYPSPPTGLDPSPSSSPGRGGDELHRLPQPAVVSATNARDDPAAR